jgi:hypothetical protein
MKTEKVFKMNGRGGEFETLYGYRSRRQFLMARNVMHLTFERMARDSSWWYQKSALLHPECPLHIREWFANDPVWYKRFVAYFATKGPTEFWERAVYENDKRIQRAYLLRLGLPARAI